MTPDLRAKLKTAILDSYQRGHGDLMVLVPHRNDLHVMKALVVDLLYDPPVNHTSWMVGDEYVRVFLNVINADAGKGQSFRAIFLPDDRLITDKKKRREAARFREYNGYMAKDFVTYQ